MKSLKGILAILAASLILSGGIILAGYVLARNLYIPSFDNTDTAAPGTPPDYMDDGEAAEYLRIDAAVLEELLESGALNGAYTTFVYEAEDDEGNLGEWENRVFSRDKLDAFMQKRLEQPQTVS